MPKPKEKKPDINTRRKAIIEATIKAIGTERWAGLCKHWTEAGTLERLTEYLSDQRLKPNPDTDYIAAQAAIAIGRRACFPTRKEDMEHLQACRAKIANHHLPKK